MNKVQKVAAGASLIGAVIGGGALTAMALTANAAVSATSNASPSTTATGRSIDVGERLQL